MSGEQATRLRIDKWLWAARFFKTRSLASQAVEGGRVQLNEQRTKPGKELREGDELRIRIDELEWVVIVRALSEQRRGAPEARLLYEETAASQAQRMAKLAARKARIDPFRDERGRPTKKDRRSIQRFTGRDSD